MSDKEKDKEPKKLTKDLLTRQIDESQRVIAQTQQQITILGEQLQQQIGVLNYARHILATFDIPAEPKDPLEVK